MRRTRAGGEDSSRLLRPHHGRAFGQARRQTRLLARTSLRNPGDYLGFLPLVSIAGTLDAVARDPDDNAVLECALTASARFLITGDEDLLVLHPFQSIEIVRAANFLRRWQAGEIKE